MAGMIIVPLRIGDGSQPGADVEQSSPWTFRRDLEAKSYVKIACELRERGSFEVAGPQAGPSPRLVGEQGA